MEPTLPWYIYNLKEEAQKKEILTRFFYEFLFGNDLEWIEYARYDKNIDLNSSYKIVNGETPLTFAVKYANNKNRDKIINLLLSPAHILVNRVNENKETALHIAIKLDDAETFIKLLYKYANLDIKNKDGFSPLDLLYQNNCPNIIARIKETPPNWLVKDDSYHRLLKATKDSSSKQPAVELSKKYNLQKSNHISKITYKKFTREFKDACQEQNDSKIIELIEKYDIDIHTNNNFPLRWTAKNGCDGSVKWLISKGADIHAWKDEALFWAVEYKHGSTAEILLTHGANPFARGKKDFKELQARLIYLKNPNREILKTTFNILEKNMHKLQNAKFKK